MREKNVQQLPIMYPVPIHDISQEYKVIGDILDENPHIYELAYRSLNEKGTIGKVGAKGMTAEQVVKAAIVMKKEGFTYRNLAFHILDSNTFRNFCRVEIFSKGFKKSTLNRNIKALCPMTWEAINQCLLQDAERNGIEKGRVSRYDCTPVDANIHDPQDSELLWDCVRVLTRNIKEANENLSGLNLNFHDHTSRAKRRALGILNAKNQKDRNEKYKDLLKVTHKTVGYSESAIRALENFNLAGSITDYLQANAYLENLKHFKELTLKVINQTERRIYRNEKVPASEKIFSIFEPHTDIIIKDKREIHYGHKICLTGGQSNMILDCVILEGNPADSTLTDQMIERQKDIYGRYPLKVSLDGGFASKENLETAKSKGIKDVCFSKGRGLEEEDMCRSKWVYRRLKNFRAGIESAISWLKRSFGLSVCNWKGFKSFKSYVWSSIVSVNLTILARHRLNAAKA